MFISFILNLKNLIYKNNHLLIAILGIVIGATFSYSLFYLNKIEIEDNLNRRQGLIGFINPILECADNAGYGIKSFGIEESVSEYISKLIKEEKKLKDISLYFKDLHNGPVINVNENMIVLGGSLFKVPLMMGLYKFAEIDPLYLKQTITITKENIGELYKLQEMTPSNQLKPGQILSFDELINLSIINSDNVAAQILHNFNQHQALNKISEDMNVFSTSKIPLNRQMSIKGYASFFRILYNSSYLSRNYSNKSLEILSRSNFKEGLRAGVPENIKVSHKFGEQLDSNGNQYFSDCGIIYHPIRPYLLCLSTVGTNIDVQINTLKKISSFVFSEVNEM